jgi:hypothetical protein
VSGWASTMCNHHACRQTCRNTAHMQQRCTYYKGLDATGAAVLPAERGCWAMRL